MACCKKTKSCAKPVTVLTDAQKPFPRVCAHRGFKSVAPDNSFPAFATAVSLGADEIEFGLWYTADGVVACVAEPDISLISNGTGMVWDLTFDDLQKYDFGSIFSKEYAGLTPMTFEAILQQFARRVVMNIFIGVAGEVGDREKEIRTKIIALIDCYDCRDFVYLTSASADLLKQARALDKNISLCFCQTDDTPCDAVQVAVDCDCKRVQFSTVYANAERVEAAHKADLKCGIYCTNTPAEAKDALALGADTLLTDDYYQVARAVK